jgi:hypothetical protein
VVVGAYTADRDYEEDTSEMKRKMEEPGKESELK